MQLGSDCELRDVFFVWGGKPKVALGFVFRPPRTGLKGLVLAFVRSFQAALKLLVFLVLGFSFGVPLLNRQGFRPTDQERKRTHFNRGYEEVPSGDFVIPRRGAKRDATTHRQTGSGGDNGAEGAASPHEKESKGEGTGGTNTRRHKCS